VENFTKNIMERTTVNRNTTGTGYYHQGYYHLITCMTASRAVNVACFISEILEDFWGQGLTYKLELSLVTMPTNLYFNSGNHSVSDMKIRALCPIFDSNDSRKKTWNAPHFQTWHCPYLYGINELFLMFSLSVLCLTLILTLSNPFFLFLFP
jgi:hypothetical protein